jgi:predicted nucleic acid-binding protein
VYDGFYLATAELLDARLWTADERFYQAAVGRFENVIRLLRTFSPEEESGGRR